MARRRRATDHRKLVLEAIITHPTTPMLDEIRRDCIGADFTKNQVEVMLWWLVKEELIGWRDDVGGYFVTRAGLEYYANALFDRELPKPHKRPRSRGRRRKTDA